LTWHQRLSYASTILGWFDSWRTLGFIVVPMTAVLTGGLPAAAPMLAFLTLFVGNWTVQRIAIQLLARGRAPLWPSTVFEFVRLPAALKATTALASARPRPFTVTDKGRTHDARRPMPAPRLLVVLLVASLVSTVWYAATVRGLTPLTYPIPWVAHASTAWTVFNGAFLAGALYRIKHRRYGSERRTSVRFRVTGLARVDGTTVLVRDVSVNGAQVLMGAPGASGTRVELDLTPLTHEHVYAVVRSTRTVKQGHLVGLQFIDLTPQARGRLVLGLFQTGATPALALAAS
jgi:hypothetical protein